MRDEFLKQIAEKGYAVSYAANQNYATYDIIRFLPAMVTCMSLFIGVLGLVWTAFTAKWISVCILLLGILSLYAEKFTDDIDGYGERGKIHTDQLNRLKNLYLKVKMTSGHDDMKSYMNEFQLIGKDLNDSTQPKQIVLASDWLAHFKLFCQKDTRWMDEQLHFGLWKDKIPQSAKGCMLIVLLNVAIYYCYAVPGLNAFFCKILYID